MNYIEDIFKDIQLAVYKQDSNCFYDPVRSILVNITPEEIVRQKTIYFLSEHLGIPLDCIRVEESMAHVKKGLRKRADIVVYRDSYQEDVLMVVECKSELIDVLGDDVFNQVSGYRDILNAEYIMIINGWQAIVYQFKDEKYLMLDNIPTYQALLESNVSVVQDSPVSSYSFKELMSEELAEAFLEIGYLGVSTPKDIKKIALNFLNLILYKFIEDESVLENIGVLEDCLVNMPHFGNSGGGSYQVLSRLFIAKDYLERDQVLGISICGTEKTENDPHWGNRTGYTQLNVSITNKDVRHHSLQFNMDKCCRYDNDTHKVEFIHNGALTVGKKGGVKHQVVIDYIQERAPELVRNGKINLGIIDNTGLLDWNHESVQELIRNLLRYAVLRDAFRAEYNK